MDVGVFSRCIKDLIVDHDKVDVSGFGIFYAENMPASFSDLRTIINPPYRRMYFAKADVGRVEGTLLFDHISEELGVTRDQAEVELSWCLGRLRSELDGNRVCVLPGLGRMKATSQHDYFFVPDDNLDICPEAFGLKPVCLRCTGANELQPEPRSEFQPKPHPEPQPEHLEPRLIVDSVLPEIKQPLDGPLRDIREIYEEMQSEGRRKEHAPKVAEEPKPTEKRESAVSGKPGNRTDAVLVILRVLLFILLAVIVAGVLLYILPDEIVDRVLYSGEEYKIIHGLGI